MDTKRIKLTDPSCDGDDGFINNTPIRTLRVAPIKPDTYDQIKMYFERFGTVNSVDMEQEQNSDVFFAMVEFKLAKSAAAVLSSKRMHRIDYCRVEVKAAEPWHQPDHILNALDDDCLRAILLKLNQSDLTNAANVCVRFNQQAKSVFSTKFKKLDLIDRTLEEAENSLKTFGSLAQSIDVGFKHYWNKDKHGVYENTILSMIAQYCTAELKQLTFRDFNFDRSTTIDLKLDSALGKLERLSFINCFFRDTSNGLLSACVELKVLHIEDCHQSRDFPDWLEFNKLEELKLINYGSLNANFVIGIITMNSKLMKITIIQQPYSCGTVLMRFRIKWKNVDIIPIIVRNHPNLPELEVDCFIISLDAEIAKVLCRLTSLKVLKLNLRRTSVEPLTTVVKGIAPIEHMKLMNGIINTDSIEAISKMKHLKYLELCDMIGFADEHLIELAKGLGSQLEKLHLEGSTAKNLTTIALKKILQFATKLSLLTLKSTTITIDADDYKAMLATIQKRPEKALLSIEFTGKGDQVGVDETVLFGNRNIFYIAEKV